MGTCSFDAPEREKEEEFMKTTIILSELRNSPYILYILFYLKSKNNWLHNTFPYQRHIDMDYFVQNILCRAERSVSGRSNTAPNGTSTELHLGLQIVIFMTKSSPLLTEHSLFTSPVTIYNSGTALWSKGRDAPLRELLNHYATGEGGHNEGRSFSGFHENFWRRKTE